MPLDHGDPRKVPADPREPHKPNPHREARGFRRSLEVVSPPLTLQKGSRGLCVPPQLPPGSAPSVHPGRAHL